MMAWIRGLNHLKIFESSRIFISLLFEVIADIKGFSIILLACLLAFSSTYDILCQGNQNYLATLFHEYRLM